MARVQYMRPHTTEELAELQGQVQAIFHQHPQMIELAVLAVELRSRLVQQDCLDDVQKADAVVEAPPANQPKVIKELIAALERALPALVGVAVVGITREEPVS